MYEHICGLSVKGKCFTENAKLPFFTSEGHRISIVYGKNGAGKTTIAEAFSAYKNYNPLNSLQVSLFSFDNSVIKIQQGLKENIFIFDEDYIDKNVRFAHDGLGTIVLIGEQVDLEERIKKQKAEISGIESALAVQSSLCAQYENPSDDKAPEKYKSLIIGKLKADDGWAGIDSKLRGRRQNSAVTENVLNEIGRMPCEKDLASALTEFQKIEELYNQVGNTQHTYDKKVDLLYWQNDTEDIIIKALAKQIERPELTERDKLILETLERNGQSRIQEIQKVVSDPHTSYCPYCFRPLDGYSKKDLMDRLQLVLTHVVEEHQAELNRLMLSPFVWDKESYVGIDTFLEQNIELKINTINSLIEKYNEALKDKQENIYTPLEMGKLEIFKIVEETNCLLEKLENERIELQKAIANRQSLQGQLILLNKIIAHHLIADEYKRFIEQSNKLVAEERKKGELVDQLQKAKNVLLDLENQKKSVKIAIDSINYALRYVFFCEGRFTLSPSDGYYQLLSNGIPVKPEDISNGERNIIALCYFFTDIMNNLEVKKAYQKEFFIVIDDPVSSFDKENRIGVLSLLKYQISRILLGNVHSKIVLLSHDLGAIYDFQRAAGEIKTAGENQYGKNSTNFCLQELKNHQLEDFHYRRRNEYTLLMQKTFDFANQSITQDDPTIGNTMRRVLEAFSTFEFKEGIDAVSCNKTVLKSLSPYSNYFEHLMYRLVLNSESHFEDQIKELCDMNFFNSISPEEKHQTAKDILSMMYLLNCNHIKAHLAAVSDAETKIQSWIAKIPKDMT